MYTTVHLLQISTHPLIGLLYCFTVLMVVAFFFIVVFSFYKRRLEKTKSNWQELISGAIGEVLFTEADADIPVCTGIEPALLHDPRFRQLFINEIIHLKKNLVGAPVMNLKKLYSLLEFDKDALKKLKSNHWHIKAKGLQELSIMEQEQYVKELFRLTNNASEQVRNEAQCALINFYGFKGFRFLNVIVHPISQWQQIQLLNYLHHAMSNDPRQLRKWLSSTNDSVVTLALRLASFYNSHDVYEDVIRCLQHPERQVKLNALRYLKKIATKKTAEEIVKQYEASDTTVQLNILSTLGDVGDEKQVPFLLEQLHHPDNKIKFAAARTLAQLHPLGTACFTTHLFAGQDPWKSIFIQIQNERAA